MKKKIFIDGSEGTTGLKINERFAGRDDLEILRIDPEKRKDTAERKRLINQSDITFLCLPDAAARESVSLVENDRVRIIDASTAHRVAPGWSYGLPELSAEFRENIRNGKRVSVPGCHATGFMVLAYPLVHSHILAPDSPLAVTSVTGFSGGGKKMIAQYRDEHRGKEYDAPRLYALGQEHKHLPEMKTVAGLSREPIFIPIVADYYAGMVVSLPVHTACLQKAGTVKELYEFYRDYYKDQKFIHVSLAEDMSFLPGNACSGWDGLNIFITGNDERVVLASQFDNLGKGASGAAVQCMNIMLGCDESRGLVL